MDAGEGVYGQLLRRFGNYVENILLRLSLIWISHQHPDHMCGLPRLLHERTKLLEKNGSAHKKVVIVAPHNVLKYAADNIHCARGHMMARSVDMVHPKEFNKWNNSCRNFILEDSSLKHIESVPVIHCPDSYGLILTFDLGERKDFKLVYTGDTRPFSTLESVGLNPDILIHEATFDDSRQIDARKKRHSTIGEALAAGARMNAKFIILTHFSQRYPLLPSFECTQIKRCGQRSSEQRGDQTPNFCVAFDHMCIYLAATQIENLRPLLGGHMQLFQKFFEHVESEDHFPFLA